MLCIDPTSQKFRNMGHNPQVMLALDGAGKVGDDVVIVEGTAEILNEPLFSLVKATPAIAEKLNAYLHIAHERSVLTQYPDAQAIFADYSQPVRVTPTRFLCW